MWGANARGPFNTSRAWFVSSPGVSIQYRHNKTASNAHTTPSASYHNINLSFSLHPPLPAAFIISQVSSLLFSSVVRFFFLSSNHFPPSALFWYSTTLFWFLPSALSIWFPGWPPHPPFGHLSCPHPEAPSPPSDRGQKIHRLNLSGSVLAILCLPIQQPPTSLISGAQKRIYWDHLSTEGMACEVLIDHLVVCTLSHTELKSHKQPSKLRDTKLYRSSIQRALCLSLDQTLRSANNSQQFRHSCFPVQADTRSWRARLNTLKCTSYNK